MNPTVRKNLEMFLVCMVLAAFSGCAALQQPLRGTPAEPPRAVMEPGDVVDLHMGKKIDFDAMLHALEGVRIIYVGEVHSRTADHAVQLRIVQGLWERGRKIGVGLEMLPRSEQEALDRWSRGDLDETALLEAVGWEENWGFPFSLYRPIFTFAREKALPMRALNAPPTVVRKVSRQGMEALSDGERRHIARHFFMDDAAHRAYVREEFNAHVPGGIRDFETFYQAQLVWDETMAESLAVWLVQEPLDHVVVLAGKGHVNQRFGIPERVRRRIDHRYAVVVPATSEEAAQGISSDVGDFLVATEMEKPFPGHGRRLGVLLERNPSGKGLRVLEVVPGSRADQAGFRPGDVIVAVDGRPVESTADLHRRFHEPDPTVGFTLEREGRTVEATISFEQ